MARIQMSDSTSGGLKPCWVQRWLQCTRRIFFCIFCMLRVICKGGIFYAGFGEILRSPHLRWAGKRKFDSPNPASQIQRLVICFSCLFYWHSAVRRTTVLVMGSYILVDMHESYRLPLLMTDLAYCFPTQLPFQNSLESLPVCMYIYCPYKIRIIMELHHL